MEKVSGNAQTHRFSSVVQSSDSLSSGPFEPFEIRYLDALFEEGVNLDVFLNNWRQAMNDDLARLDALPRESDFDHFHRVLHRLSGAVALVGAHSLMDALRRASLSPPELGAEVIDALTARARSLVTQLEATSRAFRSRS
ncbi:Hpt domain-containing protein [Paraburkholderia sp. BL18I3N2]|nr:Hpt domain-containing protein [Paraburkholderia sp. BL18I3N2]